MPSAIRMYGIHRGGAQDEVVVCFSTQASCHSVHDFHAKKPQKRNERMSTTIARTRLARGPRKVASSSMPMWPRYDCTYPLARKPAPQRQNTAPSPCQSVAAWKK